jgi:N-methylhydantoinase A
MLSDQTSDSALIRQFAEMESDARAELAAEGLRGEAVAVWKLSMRYFQQNYEQDVTFTRISGLAACLTQFHRQHEEFYGYSFPDQPVEIVHLRLSVYETERGDTGMLRLRAATSESTTGTRTRSGWDISGRAVQFDVHRRAALPSGTMLAGPAIIEEVDSTTFVPSGAQLEIHESGNLIITEAA